MVVERIPNSGWPGRPRNVGTRLAEGEYVFYADHDDYLFPEALERMHRFAVENALDVVHPKEVVKGWGRPGWIAFRRHLPRVEQLDQVLLQCITPPKLYRRQFLLDEDVWFPEGRVRLEDFSFNGLAWSRTDAIGVLADYPCYQWIIHPDNSHKASYDYENYWRSFVDSLQPVLALPDGPKKDQLLIRWYKSRILERVKALETYDDAHRTRLLATCADLLDLFPEHLDALLPVADRARSQLLRRGDEPRLLELSRLDRQVRLDVTHSGATWVDGRLRVQVEATVAQEDGTPFPLTRTGDRVARTPTDLLREAALPDWVWDLGQDLEQSFAEIVVRDRPMSVDWILPSTGRVWVDDDLRLRLTVAADVDVATAAGGAPMGKAAWDVYYRLAGLGYTPTQRVPATPGDRSTALVDGRTVTVFETRNGKLSLDLDGALHPHLGSSTVDPAELGHPSPRLDLPSVHVVGTTRLPVTLDVDGASHPGWLVADEGRARLESSLPVDRTQTVRVAVDGGRPSVVLGRDRDGDRSEARSLLRRAARRARAWARFGDR
jgi:hypothetical protein